MSWRSQPIIAGLGAYRADWDALNQRYYQGHPFADSRFIDGLLRYWATGDERLCIYEVDGRVEGLLILVPAKIGVWRQFSPSQLQAAPVLLPHTNLLNDVFACLPGFAWSIELMSQDPLYAPVELFDEGPRVRFMPYALTINVELAGDFQTYWKNRSTNLIKNIRRYDRRALDQFHDLNFIRVGRIDEIASAVGRYGALESAGWKGETGTALHPENDQGRFYASVLSHFAETGQAEVLEFWLGNKLAASRLLVYGSEIAIILKTTYDEHLSPVAPGRLLLNRLLQVFFAEQKYASVEFYTNATQDQLAWATGQRSMSHVMWFRRPILANLYDTVQNLKRFRWNERLKRSIAGTDLSAEKYDSMDELPSDALSLLAQREGESFDFSVAWFGLLINTALPEGTRQYVYVMRRADTVVCVLPVLAWKGQVTSLSTFYSSLFRPFLADNVAVRELAWLFRRLQKDLQPGRIMFSPMAPEHGSFELVRQSLRRAGLGAFRFFAFGNWYLPCHGLSYAAYQDGLSTRMRNTIKRKEKKFFQDGRGKIVLYSGVEDDPDSLNRAIEAWASVYSASWKVPEPYPDFMPELIRIHVRKNTLRLAIAFYDDNPIAAQIWLIHGKKAVIYKLAYVEQHAEHSAGTLLSAFLFRHVLDVDHVEEVDYLSGDDLYKRDWVTQRRERWGIVAYNPWKLEGLFGLIRESVGRIARVIKDSHHT